MHLQNKISLQEKIAQSTQNVADLQRANQMSMTTSQGQKGGAKKDPEAEVNLEEMLNELSREILRIYKNNLNPHADLQIRNPIDLLTVRLKKSQ